LIFSIISFGYVGVKLTWKVGRSRRRTCLTICLLVTGSWQYDASPARCAHTVNCRSIKRSIPCENSADLWLWGQC